MWPLLLWVVSCLAVPACIRWLEVLRCISRWELLQQIASGMPTDAVLFAAGEEAVASCRLGVAHAGVLDLLTCAGSPGQAATLYVPHLRPRVPPVLLCR